MIEEFVSDLEFNKQYYGKLIRSKQQTGEILDIHVPELPNEYYFFSAQDIPKEKYINILGHDIPIFADQQVEYIGQPVGILIGLEKAEITEISKKFDIKFKSLKSKAAEYSFENQKKDFFDFPIINRHHLKYGNPEKYFETPDEIIYSTMYFKNRYPYRAETAGVRVIHSDSEGLEIYLPTQWPYKVKECIASSLNVDKTHINIIPTNAGEDMNSLIWFPSLLATQASIGAKISGKNIAIDFSREEDFLYNTVFPTVKVQHKTILNKYDKIEAMDIFIIVDAGAFNPLVKEMLMQMITTATGVYHIPNFKIEAIAIKTEKFLTTPGTGWGENYVITALEKHINEITRAKHFSPIQFRLENINNENKPIEKTIIHDENFKFENIFKAICNISDFHRKYHAYKLLNNSKRIRHDGNPRGIGIATGLQYNGTQALVRKDISYSVEITLTKDNKVNVWIPSSSMDMKKILKKIVSKKLNIDEQDIELSNTSDTNSTDIKTTGTGTSFILPTIEKCCSAIEKQRFRKPLPITVKKTYKQSKKNIWNPQEFKGKPFASETPGACIVELELDLTSYNVIVKSVWLACNPGTVFSKQLVINSLKRTIATALSGVSFESSISIDNFSTYKILDIRNTPDINVLILTEDGGKSEYKDVNNIAENLVPAAYISALNQILIQMNKEIIATPISILDVFNIFESNKKNIESINTNIEESTEGENNI